MSLSYSPTFPFQFTKGGVGITGKAGSITVVIKKTTRGSSPTITTVTTAGGVTVGSIMEIDATNNPGEYIVGTSGLDPAADYIANAHYTGTSTDVDAVDVPSFQSEFSASIAAGAVPQMQAGSANGLGVNNSAGYLPVNLVQILATTLTETTTGWLVAAFKKFFNVASPTLTTAGIDQTGDSFAIVNDVTYGNSQLSRPGTAQTITAPVTMATLANQTTIISGVASVLIAVDAIPTDPLTTLGATAPAGWLNSAAFVASSLDGKGDWATTGAAMTLTSAYDAAKSAAAPGAAMTLTSGERTTLAGVIWSTLTTAIITSGSIGLKLVNWVLGADSKVMVSSDASSLPANQLAAGVLDATASEHNTAGTIGNKINAAASAGDPWSTDLPGSYAAGTAGYIVGNPSAGGITIVQNDPTIIQK